jgi:hypothetical protein
LIVQGPCADSGLAVGGQGRDPTASALAEADAWLRWYEPFRTERPDAQERLFREPGPARKDPEDL